MATLYKRDNVYYIQSSDGRKQIRKSLKTSSPRVAKQIQKEIERQLSAGMYAPKERKDCSVEEFRRRYFTWAREHKRPSTIRLEMLFLTQFVRFSDITYLGEATKDDVENFILRRSKDGLKPRSVNDALKHLQAMYNYAIKWGLVEHNPFKGVKHLKVEKNPPRYLNKEGVESVLTIAEKKGREIYLVFALGIYAGLRKNEIANARWEWFDFKHKLVTLESRNSFELKDSEARTIPLHSKLASILKRAAQKEGYLLHPEKEGDGNHRYRYGFMKAFRSVCKEAGLPWVTPHLLTCKGVRREGRFLSKCFSTLS